jgi:ankyrin repeat protein
MAITRKRTKKSTLKNKKRVNRKSKKRVNRKSKKRVNRKSKKRKSKKSRKRKSKKRKSRKSRKRKSRKRKSKKYKMINPKKQFHCRKWTESKINELLGSSVKDVVRPDITKYKTCINNILNKKTGRGALHLAINQKNDVLVELLLKGGADVKVKDTLGNTPLHLAIYQENEDIIHLLLANGGVEELVPASIITEFKKIFKKCVDGVNKNIKSFIENIPNCFGEEGAFLKQVKLQGEEEHIDLIQLLNNFKCDLYNIEDAYWSDEKEWDNKQLTLKERELEILKKINTKDDVTFDLLKKYINESENIIKAFNRDPNCVNLTDNNGNTALHLSVASIKIASVHTLCELSPDLINKKNISEKTPLDVALTNIDESRMNIIKMLVYHGAEPNIIKTQEPLIKFLKETKPNKIPSGILDSLNKNIEDGPAKIQKIIADIEKDTKEIAEYTPRILSQKGVQLLFSKGQSLPAQIYVLSQLKQTIIKQGEAKLRKIVKEDDAGYDKRILKKLMWRAPKLKKNVAGILDILNMSDNEKVEVGKNLLKTYTTKFGPITRDNFYMELPKGGLGYDANNPVAQGDENKMYNKILNIYSYHSTDQTEQKDKMFFINILLPFATSFAKIESLEGFLKLPNSNQNYIEILRQKFPKKTEEEVNIERQEINKQINNKTKKVDDYIKPVKNIYNKFKNKRPEDALKEFAELKSKSDDYEKLMKFATLKNPPNFYN